MPLFLALNARAGADQPPLLNAPDACHPIQPGDSIVEARILSFEQPRYTCDPYEGTTQGWTDLLSRRDPKHVLQPTAKTGCMLTDSHMVVLDGRALDNLPEYDRTPAQIELRVDGVSQTVAYAGMWELCGLTPGHHVVEMDTDRGPLACEGDVRAHATLTLAARSYHAVLQIAPTRLLGGAPRVGPQLAVEYDEFSFGPRAYRPHYNAFPPSEILRVWSADDGTLHAEPCPYHRDAAPRSPPSIPPDKPRNAVAPGGCAHCAAGSEAPSTAMVALLIAVALILGRRRS